MEKLNFIEKALFWKDKALRVPLCVGEWLEIMSTSWDIFIVQGLHLEMFILVFLSFKQIRRLSLQLFMYRTYSVQFLAR